MQDKTGSRMLPVLSFLHRRYSFYEDITECKEHNAKCKHLEKIHHINGLVQLQEVIVKESFCDAKKQKDEY